MSKYIYNIVPAVVLAILMLLLYINTFSRTIYLEDSAEFVTTSHTLSIPHPSGYPTYLVTSKLLSLIPIFETVVERINFVSALWTIAAVVFLYYALIKLFKNRLIAFSLSLLFALTPMVWTQATYAEVYSLNTFFFVLLMWSMAHYYEKKTKKRLYLFFFFYGLSLTNHFLPLVLAPVILAWLFRVRPTKQLIKTYAYASLFWLAGLLPYLYIPIRNIMSPSFSWFGGNVPKLLSYNIAYGYKISADTVSYLADIWHQMMISFGWLGIIAFVLGMGTMIYYKTKIRYVVFGSLALLSFALVIVLTNGRPYDAFASQFYQNLYIPFLLITLIPIACLLHIMSQSKYKLIIFYTSLLAILIWPATQLGERFLGNDRSDYSLLQNYTKALLDELPPDALLYVHHDHIINDSMIFGLAYQKYVKDIRSDVGLYSLTPVFPPPNDFPIGTNRKQKYGPVLEKYLDEHHDPSSVHTTFPRIKQKQLPHAPTRYSADNIFYYAANNNLYHKSILAKYYYDLAMHAYSKGSLISGQRFLVQAIEHDPEEFSEYYLQTLTVRNQYFND
jgi:hypothetical protein